MERAINFSGDECLIWQFSRNNQGYAMIMGISSDGKNRPKLVHRKVCEKVNGSPPRSSYDAAHECGNGHLGCVNPRHLSWKTKSDNLKDIKIHKEHGKPIAMVLL